MDSTFLALKLGYYLYTRSSDNIVLNDIVYRSSNLFLTIERNSGQRVSKFLSFFIPTLNPTLYFTHSLHTAFCRPCPSFHRTRK